MHKTRQHWWVFALVATVGLAGSRANADELFFEDFEGLTLGNSVNVRAPNPVLQAYTHTPPAGWMVDNTLGTYKGAPTVGNAGVPGQGVDDYGVDEWEGWSFASKSFWTTIEQQGRQDFALGTGVVAVADPDEYFDLGGESPDPVHGGFYNTSLKTPSITVDGTVGFQLKFDSSWLPEAFDDGHKDPAYNDLNNQSVEIIAVTNTGEISTAWNSDDTDSEFKGDATNETLTIPYFTFDPTVTSVQFYFNLANAANDWWWAIDNIEVANLDGLGVPGAPVFAEDFESVALGPNKDELQNPVKRVNNDPNSGPIAGAFTNVPPADWNRDNTTTPGQGDDNVGVYEWEGWSFADKEFWSKSGGQGRADFSKGTGTIAVADGDDWDDVGNPDGLGALNTLIETPEIDLSSLLPTQTLKLTFDSSWSPEDNQSAIVTADFGGGPLEILHWDSEGGDPGLFHADNKDETVAIMLDPAGAPSVKFSFRYIGTDDWWWAIDNISLTTVPEPSSVSLFAFAAGISCLVRRHQAAA